MKFNDILDIAKSKKKTLSVACADDTTVLKACVNAAEQDICKPVFIGDKDRMEIIAKEEDIDISKFDIIDEKDKKSASEKAVKLVSSGNADYLMKGYVDTAILLKAVLNKEWGLRTGRLLSHIAIFELDKYHKPFLITDGGMNIKPDIKQKIDIVKNAIDVYHRLGIEKPKVAILAAVEKVNEDMPETIDAAIISGMAKRGQIKGCTIDGPLAFDLAISKQSAEHKKVKSDVAGDSDILVVHDLAAGNILAKTLIYMTDCKVAGIIVGARSPIVLLSRSDNEITKMYSIALGAI